MFFLSSFIHKKILKLAQNIVWLIMDAGAIFQILRGRCLKTALILLLLIWKLADTMSIAAIKYAHWLISNRVSMR